MPAQQKIDGGPSVLYDAVAVLASDAGAALLAEDKPARDFVSDAFAHCKFIGYAPEAAPLLRRAGVREADMDDGVVDLSAPEAPATFIAACGALRFWRRELDVDLDAAAAP